MKDKKIDIDYFSEKALWSAENINRKQGSTTFKTCGWCKFTGSGTYKYNCALDSSCSLALSYSSFRNVEWNTECIIKKLGKMDIARIIESKRCKITDLKLEIKNIEKEIKTLHKEITLVKITKPPLPENRLHDYYKENDIIYVFIDKIDAINYAWHKAVVIKGYRSGDGCVSYVIDYFPQSREGWGCGVYVPTVLKEWEYKYFKLNLKDFKIWLELSDREYNGEKLNIENMYQALE